MPLKDGPNGLETLQDGKWVPVNPTKASFGIDGKIMYDYDQESGVLKLNPLTFPRGGLEEIAAAIESSPDKRLNFALSGEPFGTLYLNGVRSVQYLTPEEIPVPERTDFSGLASEQTQYTDRRTGWQRFKDYISNFHF